MRSAILQFLQVHKHKQRYGEYNRWIFANFRFKLSKMEDGGKYESKQMNATPILRKKEKTHSYQIEHSVNQSTS
jgi:hypothetical protein